MNGYLQLLQLRASAPHLGDREVLDLGIGADDRDLIGESRRSGVVDVAGCVAGDGHELEEHGDTDGPDRTEGLACILRDRERALGAGLVRSTPEDDDVASGQLRSEKPPKPPFGRDFAPFNPSRTRSSSLPSGTRTDLQLLTPAHGPAAICPIDQLSASMFQSSSNTRTTSIF